jgi:hypothetical protein
MKNTLDISPEQPIETFSNEENNTQYVILDNNDVTIADLEDVEKKLEADAYGIVPILVTKKSTYTQAHRRAQQKYREKYPEKYNALQRKIYSNLRLNEEWKERNRAKCRENNRIFREKKLKEHLESGGVIKTRGRPRKIKEPVKEEIPIQNLELEQMAEVINSFCIRCENFVTEELDMGYCAKCSEVVMKEIMADDVVEEVPKEVKKRTRKKKEVVMYDL